MKHTRPSEVRAVLEELDIRPLKALGQHFLIDANILDIILDTVQVTPDDEILEVGSGLGVLTEPMARIARRVVSVEKDRRLWTWLKSRYQEFPNLELICGDMLTMDHEELFRSGLKKVVSNLPYSVGSAILVNFLKAKNPPHRMILTLQLEVANRLKAVPSHADFGLLSLWSQLTYDVRIGKTISPSCFYPAPRVKSAIIHLVRRDPPVAELINKDFFFGLTKFAFSHRRKQLQTILKRAPEALNLSMDRALEGLREIGIDPRARPEELSVTRWCRLANTLYRQGV
ncbi:16S rRNA (adenine(1518)-N(6)/adenine(1519)-N(6))-dimethyltransferase RsmA [Verrucomicrobiota bacterium]